MSDTRDAFHLDKDYNEFEYWPPDLLPSTFGPLEDVENLEESSISSINEPTEVSQEIQEDIWSFSKPTEAQNGVAIVRSWEKFYDKSFQESRSAYISEQHYRIFDTVLASQTEASGRVIKSEALIAAMVQLGLGRESILYGYHPGKESFWPRIEDGRMFSYSLEAFRSLSMALVEQGNAMRYLRDFALKAQDIVKSFPALVALGGAMSTALSSLEAQVVDAASTIISLLQVQLLFERHRRTVACLHSLTGRIHTVKTDEDLMSQVYEVIEDAEHEPLWLRQILLDILAAISMRWQKSVAVWTGLQTDWFSECQGILPAFVSPQEEDINNEGRTEFTMCNYGFLPSGMPSFIGEAEARLIYEAGQSLRLLQSHSPDHPLAKPGQSSSITTLPLDWQFTWHDLERISARVREYERTAQEAIDEFNVHSKTERTTGGGEEDEEGLSKKILTVMSEAQAKKYLHESIAIIEQPLTGQLCHLISDSGLSGAEEDFKAEAFAPPVSLLPSLSFQPFVAAQARLVDQACLRLLIQDYDLRAHFALLYRFNLLGDGVFACRLSHALFDPELNSAERRKGHSRQGISGLKLGYRDTWPPASSELRLALTGILTDSYFPSDYADRASLFRDELPGGLSFAIREMSEEELQKCVDPHSINALDFLRLLYRPPPPLDAVITATSLLKYDAVFKLLLRAKRMLFMVNQLSRDMAARGLSRTAGAALRQCFRIESHHFVLAICAYFSDSVTSHWNGLEGRLKEVANIAYGDAMGTGRSLPKLRDFHEDLLDRMMFALLLRRRQAEVMKLIEEIFGLILRFAKYIKTGATELTAHDITASYKLFQKKVRVFINVCRGLSERGEQGAPKGTEGVNMIGHLLLKLEMNGFYV